MTAFRHPLALTELDLVRLRKQGIFIHMPEKQSAVSEDSAYRRAKYGDHYGDKYRDETATKKSAG